MKHICLALLTFLLLNSCYDCEDTSEPVLIVNFTDGNRYDHFYGIGGIDTLPMAGEVPVAINSDTSIYIFIGSSGTDTLGISYKRTIDYASENCGFAITLNSFEMLELSTFSHAEFRVYDSSSSMIGNSKRNEYEIDIYN
jgi:hypothetical protein